MSTRIEHGFRYRNPDGGDPDPFRLARDVRTVLAPVNERLYAEIVADLTSVHIDLARLEQPQARAQLDPEIVAMLPPSSATPLGVHAKTSRVRPLGTACRFLDERQREAGSTLHRDPLYDLTAAVTVLPDPGPDARSGDRDGHRDAGTSYLYLLLHAERDDYRAALADVPGVSEYSYQNASDQLPEGVTWQERQERGRTWGRVLPQTRPQDRQASHLRIELAHWSSGPFVVEVLDAVMAALGDRDARARAIANTCVPVCTVEDGQVRLRPAEDIRTDRLALRDAVLPLLTPITGNDLTQPITDAVPTAEAPSDLPVE